MASIKIFTRNALAASGVTLKNGAGAAPPLEEMADWPMSNALIADRYTYWRTSAAPPEPVQIDFDLGSDQSIAASGIGMLRLYSPGLVEPSNYVLYYGTGSYPPTWNDAGITGGLSENNNFDTFGAISARFWRFEIVTGGGFPISCKPWLVKSADLIGLGHDWSLGTDESTSRLREEVVSPAGLTFAFEPGQDRGSTTRLGNYLLRTQDQATRDALRDALTTLDSRFVVVLGDGTAVESSLPEGNLPWSRVFAPADIFDFAIPLQEHP